MTTLPLVKRLRIAKHKKVATAQDLLVTSLYSFFPDAVIHGGTSLWRCYGGNRFSEDIDVYLPANAKSVDFAIFIRDLETKGLSKIKFKKSETSIFSVFSYEEEEVSFEAVFKNIKGTATKYEMSDGTFIFVRTLTPNELMKEKITTYLNRKKIRDLYDMYFLSSMLRRDNNLAGKLNKLLSEFPKPIDADSLTSIILNGAIPTVKEMFDRLSLWAR